MRGFTWFITSLILLTVVGGYIGRGTLQSYLSQPLDPLGAPRLVYIPEGATPSSLMRRFQKEGLVRNTSFLTLYADYLFEGRPLQAGEYQLGPSLTPLELLELVEQGKRHEHTVVLRPGSGAREMGEVLAAASLVDLDGFLRAVNDSELAERLGVSGPSLEGFLYPDVWSLPRYLPAEKVVELLVRRFLDWAPDFSQAADRIGLTPYQLVIVASLVEKGPVPPSERHLYAALLLERLQNGFALESQAADEYGRQQPDAPADSSRDPWNTTDRVGLPKTPIGSPGLAALRATMEPADTEPLFMIRRGGGRHDFCPDVQCYLRLHNRLRPGQRPSFPKRKFRR